ncbi:class I SAM-dependent methyltransferase [Pelagibacterales bacterium SAG-MED07]|nr:class I SAM-dependent methyltransferase [Pelagibacterales bacterium SAG-MED07]
MVQKFVVKKLIRLINSSKVLRLFFYYHKYFKDKKLGNIGFDFSKKKSRLLIIQEIIEKKKYEKYLEIGCFDNELFNYVNCKKKVGVDPVSGGTIRDTSDNFFKTNSENFDCVFIDGLHKYHQVKKDIKNSLKFLNEGGIILLHDCLPNNYYEQAVPRCQWTWNGDVWKAIVECRTNKDIDVYTCYADFGIGVIFKRPNQNLLEYPKENYSNLHFEEYFHNHKKLMNIVEYEDLIKLI